MKKFRAGFVALLGEPNAGKSTLTNLLVDEKVSIVSDKPQTTRQRVTGIVTTKTEQIIFVDAPGFVRTKTGVNEFLQSEFKDVVKKADVLLILLAADDSEEKAKDIVKIARSSDRKWVVVITKIDLLGGTRTPKFFKYLVEAEVPFVSISAKTRAKEARSEVMARIVELLPETDQPLYDPEIYTTQTLRQMTAEIIREKCFDSLHKEVPYGLAVLINKFDEEDPKLTRISAELLLDKENHKGIVIGAKGATLKAIGSLARPEIEKLLGGVQVFLELHVKVKEGWTKNKRLMKELGYVVPE